MKKKITIGMSILVVVVVLISFLSQISNFIINIEWYSEVGYLSVYFTKIKAILKLLVPMFIVCFIGIWVYYKSLKSSIDKLKNVDSNSKRKNSSKVFLLFNFIISLFISYSFSNGYWYSILQFNNSVEFNVKDPIFNKDISFFIFKLPFIQSIYGALITLLIFLVIITLAIYFILNSRDRIYSGNFKDMFSSNVKGIKSGITQFAGKQLAIVSSLILLLLSVGLLIKSWNIVYSPRGVVFGASYTDVHVSLLFYKITAIVSFVASIVVFISVLKSRVKPIIVSVVLIIGLILGEGVASAVVQNFIVKSNEKTLEQPYIKYNIEYTRKAFNIDSIKEYSFDVKNNLSSNDIKSNKDIIDNIRINAFQPALEFYNQYQTIRPYYIFNDIDIDRYDIDNKYTQVFVTPREINLDHLDPDTWQNRHLIYTHGYGIVMSKVNSVTAEGQPNFVIKDIPPENNTNIDIENSRIYFGEKTNDYAIVNTKLKEFDYPQGGDNKINQYDGKAGIKMSFLNKILFALNENNMNFLLSRDITSDSKILINRNIVDRVKKIAPFLMYDQDPYIVAYNKKLYWIIDAYTVSDRYPFSQAKNNINYIRNSIKVVIDASDGDMDFYIVDKNDPIAISYSKIFPDLFKDSSKVPQLLKEHFKYPEDLFRIQCNVLGKYHMTDPGAFYNGDDLWEVSKNAKQVQSEQTINESPYVIMKLPNEDKEEMMILEYFNMKDKYNMVSLVGARMDKDNYGKMVMYKFPSYKTIYSPYLFKQKLKQDPVISKELSLWDTKGSEVQFGDTIIVPINNSLLYVESMYLRASGKNSAPEVKRIILSYGDKIIISENIESALEKLFNNKSNENSEKKNIVINDSSDNVDEGNIKQAKDLYNKALEAQKNGDWSQYGTYINKLGDLLNSLSK